MRKGIDNILEEYYQKRIDLLEVRKQLLLLFSVSNSALIGACKTVVDGYEGDGMENMQNRDEVFYRECKSALGHCY
jgi:hypothetical protein